MTGPSKYCSRCKHHRKIECFWKTKNTVDGLQAWCIECLKSYGNRTDAWRRYEKNFIRKRKHGVDVRTLITPAEKLA